MSLVNLTEEALRACNIETRITANYVNTLNQRSQKVETEVNTLQNTLKPVSTFLGETLGTLSGMLQDPLGPGSVLPRQIAALVEQVNPIFAANLEGTFKRYKMNALANLPGQAIGSSRNLLSCNDLNPLLLFPLIILQDIYNGLLDIISLLSDIINSYLTALYNYIFGPGGLLDDLFPGVISFIQEISLLAGEIAGLTGAFIGANPITNFASQIQNYANQIGEFIQNPLDALYAYAPPQVTQALYVLRNPRQMIDSLLPPELGQLFACLNSSTGFGLNGNMGYGFSEALNGIRGGVISSILSNYSAQYPILGPLLGVLGETQGAGTDSMALYTSPVSPNLKTSAGGFVQPQQLPEPVIPSGSQYSYAGGSATSSTGARTSQLQAAIRSAQAAERRILNPAQ